MRRSGRLVLGAAIGAALFAGWWSWSWSWPGWLAVGVGAALAGLWWAFKGGDDATPADLRNIRLRLLQERLRRALTPQAATSRDKPVRDEDEDDLNHQIEYVRAYPDQAREALRDRVKEFMRYSAVGQWATPLGKTVLPALLGIISDERFSCTAFSETGNWPPANSYVYSHSGVTFSVEQFEKYRTTIEEMWRGPVIIEAAPSYGPGCVRVRPAPKLPASIALEVAAGDRVTVGTCLLTGKVVSLSVQDVPHLLVMGTSGFGKSVFLHQLVSQFVRCSRDTVAGVLLVDLKGGVEFRGYQDTDPRVHTVWRFDDVVSAVADLVKLMETRLAEMVEKRWRTYKGGRVFLLVDEFAQIQLYPVEGKEGRQVHERLLANLNRLSMLGRAAGIVLVAAIQKATTDVMDSSFRANLQGQVCFRVANRLAAASMFGTVDDLKFDPVALPRGRFIFYDPTIGATRYLQAHVVPEPMETA